MKFVMFALISILPAAAADVGEVVAKMMQHDSNRQASLKGYTAKRRYTLENKTRQASMVVRLTCGQDGSKHFEILEEAGAGSVRKFVFRKMLDEEAAASRPNLRERSRITPENYSLRLAGTELVDQRKTYVIEVTPRSESKYLIAGKVWVDADDYAIVRIEGRPAKSLSFWTRSVNFVHTYGKNGDFWFPASNKSVAEVRIFGRTETKIEYFEYKAESRSEIATPAGEQ